MTKQLFYHGTSASVAESNRDIVSLVDTLFPEVSGNITDDIEFAKQWALRRTMGNSDQARVVVVSLDNDEVVDLGPIAGYEAHAFATTNKIEPSAVPQEYLDVKRWSIEDLEGLDPNRVYVCRVNRESVVEIRNVTSDEIK